MGPGAHVKIQKRFSLKEGAMDNNPAYDRFYAVSIILKWCFIEKNDLRSKR